jgi:hypothetical protein
MTVHIPLDLLVVLAPFVAVVVSWLIRE